jgi:hypothetical protein
VRKLLDLGKRGRSDARPLDRPVECSELGAGQPIPTQTFGGVRDWTKLQTLMGRAREAFGMVFWLVLVLGLLAAVTLILWVVERRHAWANNWLPNLFAEWTGILVAVVIVNWLLEREREKQLRPFRAHCYRTILGDLDHIGLNASSYLERFAVAGPGFEPTKDPVEAVRRMDAAFARDAVPDPNTRRSWVEMLRSTAARMDETYLRYQPFIPPPVVGSLFVLLSKMRMSAMGLEMVIASAETAGNYVPLGAAFGPAHAAVTRGLHQNS